MYQIAVQAVAKGPGACVDAHAVIGARVVHKSVDPCMTAPYKCYSTAALGIVGKVGLDEFRSRQAGQPASVRRAAGQDHRHRALFGQNLGHRRTDARTAACDNENSVL